MRAWIALTLLAAGLVTGHAAAASSAQQWTFTAARSASTTITVPRGVSITAPETVNRIALRLDPPSKLIDTKGSYAGLVIRDRHGDVVYGVVRYKSFVLFPQWSHAWTGDYSIPLPAGTYRVSVLGNAKTTVRLPITGAPARSVPVTGASSVHASEYVSQGVPVETTSLPLPLRSSSTFLTAAWVYSGPMTIPARYDYQHLCLAQAEEGAMSCANHPGGGAGFLAVSSEVEELVYAGATPRDMGLEPGAYRSNLERASSMPAQSRGFIAIVLD